LSRYKKAEFLTVEDSLQLVEAQRRSRFSGDPGSFNVGFTSKKLQTDWHFG